MSKTPKERVHCRVCNSKALTPIFDGEGGHHSILSSVRSSIRLVDNNESSLDNKKASTLGLDEIVLCDPSIDARACGLLQRKRTSSATGAIPSALFRSVRNHLRDCATEALEMISGRDCAALDIGCNDGTLLSYYPRWVERFGVDPDESIEEIGEWAWTARASFPSPSLEEAFGTKQFDIITCISSLEEVDDPGEFLRAVQNRLTSDGLFVLETLYAPVLLTANALEVTSLTNVGLYSLHVLEQMIRAHDLKIVRGNITSKSGGSIRLFITHANNDNFDFDPWTERLARLWDEETVLALRDRAPYQAYIARLVQMQHQFEELLLDIYSDGEQVVLLGTDHNAQSLFDWAGRGAKAITKIVTHHDFESQEDEALIRPVITQSDCRSLQPDYLLAPTAYKQEMLEIWRESIMAGAKIIFATPQPHVVHAGNYSAEFGKALSQGDSSAGVETLRAILFATGGPRLISENDMIQTESA